MCKMKNELTCQMCDHWIIYSDDLEICGLYCKQEVSLGKPMDCDHLKIKDVGDIIEVIDTLQKQAKEYIATIAQLRAELAVCGSVRQKYPEVE